MLSTGDLERLITEKRREIQQEKTALGLSPLLNDSNVSINVYQSTCCSSINVRGKLDSIVYDNGPTYPYVVV